jgi:hypothetical protein
MTAETAQDTLVGSDEDVERVARAMSPDVFSLPRINLYRAEYTLALDRARVAIAAMNGACRK